MCTHARSRDGLGVSTGVSLQLSARVVACAQARWGGGQQTRVHTRTDDMCTQTAGPSRHTPHTGRNKLGMGLACTAHLWCQPTSRLRRSRCTSGLWTRSRPCCPAVHCVHVPEQQKHAIVTSSRLCEPFFFKLDRRYAVSTWRRSSAQRQRVPSPITQQMGHWQTRTPGFCRPPSHCLSFAR